jgi:hypothetical protein
LLCYSDVRSRRGRSSLKSIRNSTNRTQYIFRLSQLSSTAEYHNRRWQEVEPWIRYDRLQQLEETAVGGQKDTLFYLEKETYLNNANGGKEETTAETCLDAIFGCCSGKEAVHGTESRKCRSLAEELTAGSKS